VQRRSLLRDPEDFGGFTDQWPQDYATERGTEGPGLHPVRPLVLSHTSIPTNAHVAPQDPDEERFEVDFIAIHGLTGDPWKTWTHEDGTLWLRDLLPQSLPGSRVWTYGYPADVFVGEDHSTLTNNAGMLLEEIDVHTEVWPPIDHRLAAEYMLTSL
jgi:hypothetical protein